MPTLTPVAPDAGVFAVTVGGVVSGVMRMHHVALDLGRAERAVVDPDLVDQAVEVLAPDALPPMRRAMLDVRIEPADGEARPGVPLT